MRTSVLKTILFHSIDGSKIYNGTIDWLVGLKSDAINVPSEDVSSPITNHEGTGSINGSAISIGNLVPVGYINAATLIAASATLTTAGITNLTVQNLNTTNAIITELSSTDIDVQGALTFQYSSGTYNLSAFYGAYLSTQTNTNYLYGLLHQLTPNIVTQLLTIDPTGITIDHTHWSYLSTMQNVAPNSNPTFGTINAAIIIISGAISANSLTINGSAASISNAGAILGTSTSCSGNISSTNGNISAPNGYISGSYGLKTATNPNQHVSISSPYTTATITIFSSSGTITGFHSGTSCKVTVTTSGQLSINSNTIILLTMGGTNLGASSRINIDAVPGTNTFIFFFYLPIDDAYVNYLIINPS